MVLLNFAHPLTPAQIATIEQITGQSVTTIHTRTCHFANSNPFAQQITTLIDSLDLTTQTWQTKPFLIVPPSYAPAATTLLAELHGRMGYFPTLVRIRPIPDSLPPQFEVAELINLQALRTQARQTRS